MLFARFERALPASAYQQQADMPAWVWFLIIVVVIFLFVLLWYRFGLAKGGEQPAPSVVEAKPVVAPAVAESALIAKTSSPTAVVEMPVTPDNLSMLEGIGPKIAGILQDAGIKTFAQLGNTDVAELEETLKAAGLRLADPASWPEQARLAAAGKLDELKVLQDNLKGGRRV